MPKFSQQPHDLRQRPRFRLPAMYTFVRVRPKGDERYCWAGHIYDVSESGMRFEIDEPLQAGQEIEVRAMLPGTSHITFNATGKVVRLHDDSDEAGPICMGMAFDSFTRRIDRKRLTSYLSGAGLKAA